jgi:hypothetical protein
VLIEISFVRKRFSSFRSNAILREHQFLYIWHFGTRIDIKPMRIYLALLLLISCSGNQRKEAKHPEVSSASMAIHTSAAVPDTMAHIIGERIDGPANVRDKENGKLLFVLQDNVHVAATEPNGKWVQVGLFVDVTKDQARHFRILKGSPIFVNGMEVGTAAMDIHLTGISTTNDGDLGELTGFTSISNIRPATIVENAFTEIFNHATGPLTKKDFTGFLVDFEFHDFNGLMDQYNGYEIDENWIDDPSALLRLWLIFDGDRFYGVFHSRLMSLKDATTTRVERGFYFSTVSKDKKKNEQLIKAFNEYISQVD